MAVDDGGGILNRGGLALRNSTITGNKAGDDVGGIWNDGTVTVANSTVNDNTAGDSVGGIYNDGTVSLAFTTVRGNAAVRSAGGIQNQGSLTVTSSTVDNNTAGDYGGGIVNFGGLSVITSTISANTAGLDGGGTFNRGGLNLSNSTISHNTANGEGGGIANRCRSKIFCGTELELVNTIVVGNAAPTGSDCSLGDRASRTSLGHNITGEVTGCGLEAAPGDLVEADPQLGPLQGNGGPTFTHALLSDSPAIDAGDNASCPETDQRDAARPVDGNGDGLAACDIGAYEFGSSPPPPPPPPPLSPPPIQAAPAPLVWVDVVGREVIRPGRMQTFSILYGNSGNVDAVGVPLWIGGIPKDSTWELSFERTPPPLPNGQPIVDWEEIPVHLQTDDGQVVIPLLLPVIPPGFTGVLRLTLTVPTGREFQIRTWMNRPMFQSPLDAGWECCLKAMLKNFALRLPPGLDCQFAAYEMSQSDFELIEGPIYYLDFLVAWINVGVQCVPELVSVVPIVGVALGVAAQGVELVLDVGLSAYSIIRDKDCIEVWQQTWDVLSPVIRTVTSFDPNEKVGSRGVLEAHYLSEKEPLRYTILFENLETADAPAQEVLITDQLDVANMDLNTFNLGPISFGETKIVPPPGLSVFDTEVDLRPENNLIVKIEGGLDMDTGLLTWRFVSIDPETGQLPEDPLAGFLPPNVTPPEGDGSVLFTVMPKDDLPTGTEIRNQATIVFDVNPGIEDSGIKDYTVFVSEDGGPFEVWLDNYADTSATFTGQRGRTYFFYSIARDHTGNVEDPPAAADALTKIVLRQGDVNGDGEVNTADLIFVLANWGIPNDHRADLTGDGVVDVRDLVLVAIDM